MQKDSQIWCSEVGILKIASESENWSFGIAFSFHSCGVEGQLKIIELQFEWALRAGQRIGIERTGRRFLSVLIAVRFLWLLGVFLEKGRPWSRAEFDLLKKTDFESYIKCCRAPGRRSRTARGRGRRSRLRARLSLRNRRRLWPQQFWGILSRTSLLGEWRFL